MAKVEAQRAEEVADRVRQWARENNLEPGNMEDLPDGSIRLTWTERPGWGHSRLSVTITKAGQVDWTATGTATDAFGAITALVRAVFEPHPAVPAKG